MRHYKHVRTFLFQQFVKFKSEGGEGKEYACIVDNILFSKKEFKYFLIISLCVLCPYRCPKVQGRTSEPLEINPVFCLISKYSFFFINL